MVGDYEKAIEAFDFALTCDDSDTELKILKAYCLYMNESYEKAIEEYQEIEGDEEVMRRISPLMAECYMKLEQYEKAYQLFSTIINDPDMEDGPTNYINYIRCCTETERDNEASIMLFKAAQLYPNNVRLLSLFSAFACLIAGKRRRLSLLRIRYSRSSIRKASIRKLKKNATACFMPDNICFLREM
mgnify:CR=1 FL=1